MNTISPKNTRSVKMNKNIIIVLGGAIMAAVLVAVLVQVTLGGKKSAPVGDVSQVLVAAKVLKKGHELEEGDLRWQKWAENSLYKGVVIRKDGKNAEEALKGRIERSFAKGEAVTRRDLIRKKGNLVAARLKKGERAVSVKLKAEDMVAGFITPGSYVDVILTYKNKVSFGNKRAGEDVELDNMLALNLSKMASETILENVRVLALDQKSEVKKDDKIKVGKTVTLALDAEGAEKLALASEMGRVTLSMRGVGDDAINKKLPTISDARLISIDDEIFEKYLELQNRSSKGFVARTSSSSNSSNSNEIKIYNGANVAVISVN